MSRRRQQASLLEVPEDRECFADGDPWAYEKLARSKGYNAIVGVDEAGRGPLAGPVVAGAVLLPPDFDAQGIRDSKVMTPAAREAAYDRITQCAISMGVGIVSPEVIDSINILQATYRAMNLALGNLCVPYDLILVDGLPVPGLPAASEAIVDGDALSVSISAASIVAKVTRDKIMIELDCCYPEYGFAAHKGYCTPEHLAALNRCGPCPIHRLSFSPMAERIANCPIPGLE